ncbi:transposase [Aurantimonas sp. C2-3-R2]|uniref:transposase n=1 Tax=unclassified Aurantimonas TaxID=2638230 RepID=UPI003FA4271C
MLTLLAPSERSDHQRGRRHKMLTDWARQGALQLCRWLPDRDIVFVGDSSFAVHELAHALDGRATLISRLRLDANLFAPPPGRGAHTIGRPAQKGLPLPKLKTLLSNPATQWRRITVSSWYGRKEQKALEITSDTALWYRCGTPPQAGPLGVLAHAGKSGRRVVSAFIATAFAQETPEAASLQWRSVSDQIRPKVPKLAAILDGAEEDVLAYMTFPREHRAKLHSINPIERLNGEIKRRTDVVGIFPNDEAILRLVGALLLEQNDEWAIQRARYMTLESVAPLSV